MNFPPRIRPKEKPMPFVVMDKRSKDRIVRQSSKQTLKIQGSLLELKISDGPIMPINGGKKKDIMGFSRKSRLNLVKKMAVWHWEKIGVSTFITLTYPDEFALPDQKKRNKQRYLFHRKIEEQLERQVPCLWRIEYAVRKSGTLVGQACPHWHMLLFGVNGLDPDGVNHVWNETVGECKYIRTDTVEVDSGQGAAKYLGKYIAKTDLDGILVNATYHNNKGRHWGILRQEMIPKHEPFIFTDLSDEQRDWIVAFAEQFLPWIDSRCPVSLTLIGQLCDDAVREFYNTQLDKTGG